MQATEAPYPTYIETELAKPRIFFVIVHVGDAGAVGGRQSLFCYSQRVKRETNLIAHVGDAGAVSGRKQMHHPRRLRRDLC